MTDSFECSVCGGKHSGLRTDQAYKLPDVIWAIPEKERSARAKCSPDLCQLDERYFIRCILHVPFSEDEGDFGWGVWAEVTKPVFDRYLELYDEDGSAEPLHAGILANDIRVYESSLGMPVDIQFQEPTQRPSLHARVGDHSRLAIEQRIGIGRLRYHEILEILQSNI